MQTLDSILRESTKRHKHLCPRQVLGARMGLFAAELLGIELPRHDKRLLAISETDGCAVDGLIAATGCRVGSRTLRIVDFGKVAATFVDAYTEKGIRIVPHREVRSIALKHVPNARNAWEAMLLGYQEMCASELFVVKQVELDMPLSQLVSRPGMKAICEVCDEEIINGREVVANGIVLCLSCSGKSYYHHCSADIPTVTFPNHSALKTHQ